MSCNRSASGHIATDQHNLRSFRQLMKLKAPPSLQASLVRPSGVLGGLISSNVGFLFKIPAYLFGPFPLYTWGLVSRRNFYLIGLTALVLKMGGLLTALAIYLHLNLRLKETKPVHPWTYTSAEEKELEDLLTDWMGFVAGAKGTTTSLVMFSVQLGLSLLLILLTLLAIKGQMPRRRMHGISRVAKFINFIGLFISFSHVLQLLLPKPFISQLAEQKLSEMQELDLANTTKRNLHTYYDNRRKIAANMSLDSLQPPDATLLDKVQFNQRCCGIRSTDDWLEFASGELAVFAEFLRPGQLPPSYRTEPPASCSNGGTGETHSRACAVAFDELYTDTRFELLPLMVVVVLGLVSACYLQRAYTAQDGLSGLEPDAIQLAGDVAATSSLTGGSVVSNRQINTTVPLVSVPTRMVRPVFQQCPKIGECTADVAHARLGYNEPLSFEERTTVTCSPQFFPLCFSPESGALISLLQFCIRVIWGMVIYQVFVTNFARFYDTTSLGSGAYSHLLSVATLVAFVFPVVVSKRFLLVTFLFIPSLFLEFGGAYVTSKIVEAVFSGPFQTLLHNLNQTQLSMQCFMLSGTDLAEAGLKLSVKPFVNIAHEFMTSTVLLGFLFKKLNSSASALHREYTAENGTGTSKMYNNLAVKNEEMEQNVYVPLDHAPPSNPDDMSPDLQASSLLADQELQRSEEEDAQEEAQAIEDMNSRIAIGKATVKLARDKYNKFTSTLSRLRQNGSSSFKRKIKKMCKKLVYDVSNKCNQLGDALCGKFDENIPWYMKMANFFLRIFDCPKLKSSWKASSCDRLKPPDFVKKQCIDFAKRSSPLPGTDGEFLNALSMIENLYKFATVDFEFMTVVGRFLPDFSAEFIFIQMAEVAFLLIEMARLGILKQTWQLINDMMIGTIIGEIFIFIKRFNTDLSFCNHYVTQQFIEIDYRRKQTIVNKVTNRARDSLLPFAGWEMREPVWIGTEHEEELIAYPEQLRLTDGERSTIKQKYIADLGMLSIIGVILLANYLVVQAVDTMNAGLPANLTFEGTSNLNVTVHGVDGNLAKRLTFGLVRDLTHTAVVNTTVELEDCKVTTKRMGDEDVNAVLTLIVLKLCMNLLYGYMNRLRPFMCALFYPEQQRRRTVALYNQLLRRRAKRQRFFRDQVLQRILAEKFNRDPFGIVTRLRLRSPTWNSVFGSLPFMNGNVECLCCGDRGFEQFKICLDCSGSYCRPCWYRLNSMCLLCILLYKRLALDYEDYRENLREALDQLVEESEVEVDVTTGATPLI